MAGSEENFSCDLGSERVKILTTTSMHSSCAFNFVNTKQTEHLIYIYNIHVQCILLLPTEAALSRHVRQCVH